MHSPTTTIKLNTSVSQLLDATPINFKNDCLQEIGTCWYKFSKSANSESLPTARIISESSDFSSPYVSGISIYSPPTFNGLIQNLTVTLRGLPDNSLHSEQKDFLYSIISELLKGGWRRYLYPSDPRISGQEGRRLPSGEDVLGSTVMSHPWFDPSENMTLEQWLSITNTYEWYFVDNNDNHLLLKVWKSNDERSPKTRGTYLITLEFDSEESFWRKSFKQKDKENWINLLPKTIQRFEEDRSLLENKAEAIGIAIDQGYRPPAIRALQK